METAANILAQLAPVAAVETNLFAVASSQNARIDEIVVCNRVSSPASFRISVSIRGAATAAKDYLYFDLPISANDTFALELGLTLGALDTIRVYTGSASLTFTLIGANI